MSHNDTPRTDAEIANTGEEFLKFFLPEFARQLERELNEANARLDERLGRKTTHTERCHLWHIDCAVRRFDAMTKERDAWRKCAEKFAALVKSGEEIWHDDQLKIAISDDDANSALDALEELSK